jgi:monoamine oxidase
MSRSFYATLRRLNGNEPDQAGVLDTLQTRRDRLHRVALMPDGLSRTDLDGCTTVAGSRIAVIGAGFAGLAAAWYLSQAGVNVTVFEASDRSGGRVLTDRDLITDKYIEAGAELVGENHPLWWEFASLFGLQLVPLTTPEDYESRGLAVRLRLGNHDLTPDERLQVDADLLPVVDAIGQDAKDVDPEEPWAHPNAAALDSLSVSDRLDQLLGASSSLARQVIEFTIANDNCAPVARQSYLGLLTLVSAGRTGDDPAGLRGYWESTETHRCGGGNDQLATQLAGTLSDVRLSSPVDTISVSADGIGLDVSGNAGGSFSFDYAVMTASPFSWPSVQSDLPWNPADRTMSHGPAVKYISAVDTRFWEPDGLAPSTLWDGIGSVWEGTDNQPEQDGGFALSVYSGGPYVLSSTQYPGQLSQLYPSVAPFATRFVDWPSTSHVLTGYSIPAPGEVTTIARTLADPFGDRLFFAGEQACPGFFGYMEGALLSGLTAGRRIVQVLCPGAIPQVQTA